MGIEEDEMDGNHSCCFGVSAEKDQAGQGRGSVTHHNCRGFHIVAHVYRSHTM